MKALSFTNGIAVWENNQVGGMLAEADNRDGSAEYILVMGVSGAGKSTIGKALAAKIGGRFIEADDLHPADNIVRMSKRLPLTDEQRWPWLKAISFASLKEMQAHGGPIVIACSALKRSYRDILRQALSPLSIIHLTGTMETIKARLEGRASHFMPAELLGSQLAILEPPEPDENGLSIPIDASEGDVVEAAIRNLESRSASKGRGVVSDG